MKRTSVFHALEAFLKSLLVLLAKLVWGGGKHQAPRADDLWSDQSLLTSIFRCVAGWLKAPFEAVFDSHFEPGFLGVPPVIVYTKQAGSPQTK